MSYPESSQRTVVLGDGEPPRPSCSRTTNRNLSNDMQPTLSGHEGNHLPHILLAQSRVLSLPTQNDPYIYHSDPVGTPCLPNAIDDSHPSIIPAYAGPDDISYCDRASPGSLQSLLYQVRKDPMSEKPNIPGRYEARSVDARSYASLRANNRNDLGTSCHSLTMSTILMSNMGWSSASPPDADDHVQLHTFSDLSTIHGSDTPATAFSTPEYMGPWGRDAAASPSSEPTDDVASHSKKKKSKMHQCEVCGKLFPRPSGLKTHMNTHNNLKPFPCTFEGCTRTFTVRSNAKRHLRTHGIETVIPRVTMSPPYSVGFDTPTVLSPTLVTTHEMSKIPYKLRWMPPSLSSRTNADTLRSLSDDDSSDDDYDKYTRNEDSQEPVDQLEWKSAITIPCRPVVPSPSETGIDEPAEERNSYIEAPLYPYHPAQFRVLPGPALASPANAA